MGKHIYKVWQERIASGTFTKSECQQYAAVIARTLKGREPRGKRTNLTLDMCIMIDAILRQNQGVTLTEEHTAQGLAWIGSRQGRAFFGENAQQHILSAFDHFRFMGDAEIGPNNSTPVWRIMLKWGDGRMIDYTTASWQERAYNGATGSWQYVTDADDRRRLDAIMERV